MPLVLETANVLPAERRRPEQSSANHGGCMESQIIPTTLIELSLERRESDSAARADGLLLPHAATGAKGGRE